MPTIAPDGYTLPSGPTASESHPAPLPSCFVPDGANTCAASASMLSSPMPVASAAAAASVSFGKIDSGSAQAPSSPRPRTKYHMK